MRSLILFAACGLLAFPAMASEQMFASSALTHGSGFGAQTSLKKQIKAKKKKKSHKKKKHPKS